MGLWSTVETPVIDWYSVECALPNINERVLVVCTNPQNHMQRHVSICDYWGIKPLSSGVPMWSGYKEVTHWAPLPELPKEEKDE